MTDKLRKKDFETLSPECIILNNLIITFLMIGSAAFYQDGQQNGNDSQFGVPQLQYEHLEGEISPAPVIIGQIEQIGQIWLKE